MRSTANWIRALAAALAMPSGASASIPVNLSVTPADPNTFVLEATVTNPDDYTYQWSKGSLDGGVIVQLPSLSQPADRNGNGPGPVVFDSPDQRVTGVRLDVIGTYHLMVTVTEKADPTDQSFAFATIDFAPGAVDARFRDPNTHLRDFLSEKVGATRNATNPITTAYYRAVDPGNERTTLADFIRVNRLDQPGNSVSSFLNMSDLADGLRLTIRVNDDQHIASTFGTYESADDADDDENAGVTVAMEYSPGPGNPTPFAKFFMYDAAGNRVQTVDFDGGGARRVPDVCATCHGGNPAGRLTLTGAYPRDGNIGGSFAPLDVAASEFTTSHPRSSQENAIFAINQAVRATHPNAAVVSLIDGWYRGQTGPDYTQDTGFVPAGFKGTYYETVYSQVLAKSCRGCHSMIETEIVTMPGFREKRSEIQRTVLQGREPLMPHAIPDYIRFWKSTAPHQPDVLQDALNH